jgi:hypothetical protein
VQVAEADENVVQVREGSPLPLDEWQLVVMVADGALVRLYRNAVEVGSVAYDGTLKTTRPALGIGVKPNGAGTGPNNVLPAYWHGKIDDVRIYDRALCENEIAALWAGAATGAGEAAPLSFSVSSSPNPFRDATRIRYALPQAGDVTIAVYDVRGRMVRELVRARMPAGSHVAEWRGDDRDGHAVGSGVYFYKVESGDLRQARKLLLLR